MEQTDNCWELSLLSLYDQIQPLLASSSIGQLMMRLSDNAESIMVWVTFSFSVKTIFAIAASLSSAAS